MNFILHVLGIVAGVMILAQIAGAIERALARGQRIEDAARALYAAAHWRSTEATRLSVAREVELWTELRDSLELAPGTATRLGVGEPLA